MRVVPAVVFFVGENHCQRNSSRETSSFEMHWSEDLPFEEDAEPATQQGKTEPPI
jgi:hypothetical protein